MLSKFPPLPKLQPMCMLDGKAPLKGQQPNNSHAEILDAEPVKSTQKEEGPLEKLAAGLPNLPIVYLLRNKEPDSIISKFFNFNVSKSFTGSLCQSQVSVGRGFLQVFWQLVG